MMAAFSAVFSFLVRMAILTLFMTPAVSKATRPPESLKHGLNKYFPALLRFESTSEFERSDLHSEIREEAERILNSVVGEDLSEGSPQGDDRVRALAWNIERGTMFDGIVKALRSNEDMRDRDLMLLTELDHGMARSGNRYVAGDLARELGMNYAFAPVYIALQKGGGVEVDTEGENTASIHGLAMFSKWPMRNIHAIPLPNGKDKMRGKEKRLGWLRALIADIDHPVGTFRAVTVHLDAHCSRAHRRRQMRIILDHLDTLPEMPTLIGGDWNTTTFNSQNSRRAIMGYWRRVLMGPKRVASKHLPHPERYFEKGLFGDVERRGYDFRSLNEVGTGTLHYHVESIEKNTNLRDWVPAWCFPFIFWAANRVGGTVSGRLDWFAGKGIKLAPGSSPKTVGELTDTDGTPLSDHDAITVDFVPVMK